MRPFTYLRASDIPSAVKAGAGGGATGAANRGDVQFIAGGTLLLDLMKLDNMRPLTLVDINDLQGRMRQVEAGGNGLWLGALVHMADAADHPAILRDYPMIAQALQLAASAQLRNMATLGGNVLQRTRCQYFRDPSWSACNKRDPGSGCAAMDGVNRKHAVLGVGDKCIAEYPGDFAQALVALDARVHTSGPAGSREFAFEQLHLGPERPEVETVLAPGELITGFTVPSAPWARRSLYLKIRDRQSYAFALASAAVALDMDEDVVRDVRIALGGVAYRPWRAHEAEAMLKGQPLDEARATRAARAAFANARPRGENAYKPRLGEQTLVRALMQCAAMEA